MGMRKALNDSHIPTVVNTAAEKIPIFQPKSESTSDCRMTLRVQPRTFRSKFAVQKQYSRLIAD